MPSFLDHLVITAPTLERGIDYVRRSLGVEMQAGGKHPRMGTHNYFLKLGERRYLEVISVDPAAPKPTRKRWFDMDRLAADSPVRLATWVARTDDIAAAVAACPEALGDVGPMSRGTLEWLITIPADGSLALGGMAPTLIQWPEGTHPTNTLDEKGCRLLRLEIVTPQVERMTRLLQSLRFEDAELQVLVPTAGESPQLIAYVETPGGKVEILKESQR